MGRDEITGYDPAAEVRLIERLRVVVDEVRADIRSLLTDSQGAT